MDLERRENSSRIYDHDFDLNYDFFDRINELERRDMRFAHSQPSVHAPLRSTYTFPMREPHEAESYSGLRKKDQLLSENKELLERLILLQEKYQKKEQVWEKEREHFLRQRKLEKGRAPPGFGGKPSNKRTYPSNDSVISNLIKSQIEFYFSEYHLKRDKSLLEKLCDCKTYKGFLSFDEVCQLSKIRTLGQEKPTILRALKLSEYLTLLEKDGKMYVGRENFEKPKQMEFPFRRTVFAYGIPLDKDADWVRQQFECFGGVNKIQFDSGSNSTKRKVGARLLNQEKRVSKLFSEHDREFVFKHGDSSSFVCGECKKLKKFSEGCYVSEATQEVIFCIQCAAKQAEKRNPLVDIPSEDSIDLQDNVSSDSEKLMQKFKTCLIVYDSQRQASKCVYVRSRLGIEGCFAAHFHQYTKEKKLLQSDLGKEGTEMRLEKPVMRIQKSSPIHTDYKQESAKVPHFSQFLPRLARRPLIPQGSTPLFT